MADKAHHWTPEEVRSFMVGESPEFARERRRFMRIPANPRCKLCLAPFGGLGGVVLKAAGFGRSAGNPAMCAKCETELRHHGLTGVEIPVTLLFSDVRGSTTLGEHMRPKDFKDFLDRFYRLATDAITHHDGLVDKIVGDEVIGLFFGGISGPNHAGAAIAAAVDLAERASRPDASPAGPIPAGTAVHTGDAFVGSTGPAETVPDFTALGDPVNTTARLASLARAGEVIVSVAATEASGTSTEGLEHRRVDLRGRSAPLEVVVLRAAQAGLAPSP
jgi:adenylate cyclase